MSGHDQNGGNQDGASQENAHFDEVDAVRRFPSEDTWLELPMPDLQADGSQADRSQADHSQADHSQADGDNEPQSGSSFTDRVMQAREEDLELDAQIAKLDEALPSDVLRQFGAPKVSDSFVEQTVKKITAERRQRWQEMLSRHVAPEPSPEFVSRTLAALQDGQATKASGKHAVAHAQLPAPQGVNGRRHNWPVFGLVAAAAAALLWVALTGDSRQPLEIRLSDQVSPAVAYASSTSPMSAILAQVADDEEPFAMFDEPADGLWLVSDSADSEELR